jgi:hypothetical protein
MAKQRWDGIAIFRAAIAVWLALTPWLLPASDWMHRLSGALSGVLMLCIAAWAQRRASLRYLQGLVGVWVMASAALLAPGPIMISSLVSGFVVLVTAFATSEMFQE